MESLSFEYINTYARKEDNPLIAENSKKRSREEAFLQQSLPIVAKFQCTCHSEEDGQRTLIVAGTPALKEHRLRCLKMAAKYGSLYDEWEGAV